MVFVFYAIAIVFMLLLRPFVLKSLLKSPSLAGLPDFGKGTIQMPLYFFPQLAGVHAVCAGLICK